MFGRLKQIVQGSLLRNGRRSTWVFLAFILTSLVCIGVGFNNAVRTP